MHCADLEIVQLMKECHVGHIITSMRENIEFLGVIIMHGANENSAQRVYTKTYTENNRRTNTDAPMIDRIIRLLSLPFCVL